MRAVKEVSLPEEGGKLAGMVGAPARFRRFLRDVRTEMRSVTWPSRDDLRSTTVTVLATTFFFGFYLGVGLDVPFSWVMGWLLKIGAKLIQG